MASPPAPPGMPRRPPQALMTDCRAPDGVARFALWSFDHSTPSSAGPVHGLPGREGVRDRGLPHPGEADLLLHLDPVPALRLVGPEVQVRAVPDRELVDAAADLHAPALRYGCLTITGGWPIRARVASPSQPL